MHKSKFEKNMSWTNLVQFLAVRSLSFTILEEKKKKKEREITNVIVLNMFSISIGKHTSIASC